MDTFPVYDYPLWGNEPLENTEDVSGDTQGDMFKTYVPPATRTPVKIADQPPSSFVEDFTTAIGSGLAYPFKAVAGAASSVVDTVKSTTRNVFLYLVGGIALIGIIAIIAMGVGSRFMARMEGH